MRGGGIYVLNFYSAVFVDQLKRGRKTATIRLGDKSGKYERGQVVWVTVGFRHSPREKIFAAVIDDVEIKKIADLSPRDIEHDNPEFRRLDETTNFLEQIYGRPVGPEDVVTVIRFSQIVEPPGTALRQRRDPVAELAAAAMAEYRFLTTWLLDAPRDAVWDAIYDSGGWPSWWQRRRARWSSSTTGDEDGLGSRCAYDLAQLPALRPRLRDPHHPGRAAAPARGAGRRRAGRHRPLAPLRAATAPPRCSTSGT